MTTYGQLYGHLEVDRDCNPICNPVNTNITASNDVNISASNDIDMTTSFGNINLSPAGALNIRVPGGIGLETETVEPVATGTPNIFTVTYTTDRPVKIFPYGGVAVAAYNPLPAGGGVIYRVQSTGPKSVLSVSAQSAVSGSGTKDLTVHNAIPTAGNTYDIVFGNTDNANPLINFGGYVSILEYNAL